MMILSDKISCNFIFFNDKCQFFWNSLLVVLIENKNSDVDRILT